MKRSGMNRTFGRSSFATRLSRHTAPSLLPDSWPSGICQTVLVLAPVPDMACRTGCEFFAHVSSQVIAGIGIEPAANVEPLCSNVTIPAVLICQNHLDDIAAVQAK